MAASPRSLHPRPQACHFLMVPGDQAACTRPGLPGAASPSASPLAHGTILHPGHERGPIDGSCTNSFENLKNLKITQMGYAALGRPGYKALEPEAVLPQRRCTAFPHLSPPLSTWTGLTGRSPHDPAMASPMRMSCSCTLSELFARLGGCAQAGLVQCSGLSSLFLRFQSCTRLRTGHDAEPVTSCGIQGVQPLNPTTLCPGS